MNIFVIFSSFPHFADSEGKMKVEYFMMPRVALHIFADIIFGISQKPLYVTSSNMVR